MNIRRALTKDINDINKLLFQVLEIHRQGRPDLFKNNTKKYTEDELLSIIGDDTKPVFVCVDENDHVLGYAFCIFKEVVNDNILKNIKTLYIDDLCVDENARGKCIGKSLYNYVINYAKKKGFYNVTLNVWACNEAAVKFYEGCGLKVKKTEMEFIL